MTGSVKRAWNVRFSFRTGHIYGCKRFEAIITPWVVPDWFPNTSVQCVPSKTAHMPLNKHLSWLPNFSSSLTRIQMPNSINAVLFSENASKTIMHGYRTWKFCMHIETFLLLVPTFCPWDSWASAGTGDDTQNSRARYLQGLHQPQRLERAMPNKDWFVLMCPLCSFVVESADFPSGQMASQLLGRTILGVSREACWWGKEARRRARWIMVLGSK